MEAIFVAGHDVLGALSEQHRAVDRRKRPNALAIMTQEVAQPPAANARRTAANNGGEHGSC
ncbi:hypothetical protein [Nannocystis radixulma]|uniref:Uncharacterized protein n=1 Tax=Nannocystis radixulma TaxID=2995305 RepID=A0ABT5AWE7_9BACT|nr:hypothetical protein [Nannocystis radixulma]MDC0666165.1 hypothetical protein [Nannocystis radixulma]